MVARDLLARGGLTLQTAALRPAVPRVCSRRASCMGCGGPGGSVAFEGACPGSRGAVGGLVLSPPLRVPASS